MPEPFVNSIPDNENWKFIQRFPHIDNELKPLAKSLVTYDNKIYEPSKADILAFLGGSVANRNSLWSDYWISIIQTLGLAYTTPQDTLLHTTALAKYLAETDDPIEAFFYYWALRFQFPWSQNKHKKWKESRKRVLPVVFMMQHLVALYERALERNEPPFIETYLTYEEVVLVLMKSKEGTSYAVEQNVNEILKHRRDTFDYKDLRVSGYDTVKENFANRARLYIEKADFVRFNSTRERVELTSSPQLVKILAFLSYVKEPISVGTDETDRVNLFEKAFNNLEPHPSHLYRAITRWH